MLLLSRPTVAVPAFAVITHRFHLYSRPAVTEKEVFVRCWMRQSLTHHWFVTLTSFAPLLDNETAPVKLFA